MSCWALKKKTDKVEKTTEWREKKLFMRCICIWLGKMAGAWIWPQTII